MVTTNFCTLSLTGKGKGKIHLEQSRMGLGGQRHAPVNLPPRKRPWYPLYRRLGGPQGQLHGCGKSCIHQDSILNHQACSESLYCIVHWLMTLPLQKGINAVRSDVPPAVFTKFRTTAVSHHVDFKQLTIL